MFVNKDNSRLFAETDKGFREWADKYLIYGYGSLSHTN